MFIRRNENNIYLKQSFKRQKTRKIIFFAPKYYYLKDKFIYCCIVVCIQKFHEFTIVLLHSSFLP